MDTQDTQFDGNLFYCVAADDSQHVVVAANEDEIPGAKLVISLAEVERIRATLVSAKTALKLSSPLEQVPDAAPTA